MHQRQLASEEYDSIKPHAEFVLSLSYKNYGTLIAVFSQQQTHIVTKSLADSLVL